MEVMRIYQRCSERKCLPYAGGVMDQPESLMRSFDVIDERMAAFKKKQREDAERGEEFARLRGELHGRR